MKEKVILKSVHPEEYPDLVIECKIIPNDKIGKYLATIPNEKKFYAYKSKPVKARYGKIGEEISSVLKTIVDGKEYILSEEKNTVKERTVTKENEEVTYTDIVVTNYESTSNEQYIVKYEKFGKMYDFVEKKDGEEAKFIPKYESRLLTQVDENLIIITSWGAKVVCLAGSYIVTYNAEESDYNAVEKGAFESTYTKEEPKTRKLV